MSSTCVGSATSLAAPSASDRKRLRFGPLEAGRDRPRGQTESARARREFSGDRKPKFGCGSSDEGRYGAPTFRARDTRSTSRTNAKPHVPARLVRSQLERSVEPTSIKEWIRHDPIISEARPPRNQSNRTPWRPADRCSFNLSAGHVGRHINGISPVCCLWRRPPLQPRNPVPEYAIPACLTTSTRRDPRSPSRSLGSGPRSIAPRRTWVNAKNLRLGHRLPFPPSCELTGRRRWSPGGRPGVAGTSASWDHPEVRTRPWIRLRRLPDDCRRRNRPRRSVTARRGHRGAIGALLAQLCV